MKRTFIPVFFLIVYSFNLFAADNSPRPYGPAEFPEWQKDLRRAEILSFGALPFMTFFSAIYYDIYRYYSHDEDKRYLPWPFKKADIAVPLTEQEQKNILFTSAGISVGVALIDFSWRAIRRSIRNKKALQEQRLHNEPIRIESVVPVQ